MKQAYGPYSIIELIAALIDDKKYAWSQSTIRSERARLQSLATCLDGSAERLWAELENRGTAAYTRSTVWTRVVTFWDWAIESGKVAGPNGYSVFRRKNARLFKNTYTRKVPDLAFDEVIARLKTLRPEVQAKALQLLNSGMRYTESFTLSNNQVIGKGGKVREVFQATPITFTLSYSTFLRELKSVGLKSHDLRKLCAMNLVDKGATMIDLKEIFGWASFETASSYIKAKRGRLAGLFK